LYLSSFMGATFLGARGCFGAVQHTGILADGAESRRGIDADMAADQAYSRVVMISMADAISEFATHIGLDK